MEERRGMVVSAERLCWVGGWVGFDKMEEEEGVGMRCCERWGGGGGGGTYRCRGREREERWVQEEA